MTSEVALPTQFRDILRERILSSFMDLIPKEKINELVDGEIKAWFETEQLLTITQTTIEVDNPKYEPGKYHHGNDRTHKRDHLVVGSKMTPFRQLVWTTLHQELTPRIRAIINDENSGLGTDLKTWLETQAQPNLAATNKELFSNMSMGMSTLILRTTMTDAIHASHVMMTTAFANAGMNTSNMPVFIPTGR